MSRKNTYDTKCRLRNRKVQSELLTRQNVKDWKGKAGDKEKNKNAISAACRH